MALFPARKVCYIPATDLSKTDVIAVDPAIDFCGWGLRWLLGPAHKV